MGRETPEKPPLRIVSVCVEFEYVLRDDDELEFGPDDYLFAERVFEDMGGWSSLSQSHISISRADMHPHYRFPQGWCENSLIYGPQADVKLGDAVEEEKAWREEAERIAAFQAKQVPLFPPQEEGD